MKGPNRSGLTYILTEFWNFVVEFLIVSRAVEDVRNKYGLKSNWEAAEKVANEILELIKKRLGFDKAGSMEKPLGLIERLSLDRVEVLILYFAYLNAVKRGDVEKAKELLFQMVFGRAGSKREVEEFWGALEKRQLYNYLLNNHKRLIHMDKNDKSKKIKVRSYMGDYLIIRNGAIENVDYFVGRVNSLAYITKDKGQLSKIVKNILHRLFSILKQSIKKQKSVVRVLSSSEETVSLVEAIIAQYPNIWQDPEKLVKALKEEGYSDVDIYIIGFALALTHIRKGERREYVERVIEALGGKEKVAQSMATALGISQQEALEIINNDLEEMEKVDRIINPFEFNLRIAVDYLYPLQTESPKEEKEPPEVSLDDILYGKEELDYVYLLAIAYLTTIDSTTAKDFYKWLKEWLEKNADKMSKDDKKRVKNVMKKVNESISKGLAKHYGSNYVEYSKSVERLNGFIKDILPLLR